jgi:hypothetical protein
LITEKYLRRSHLFGAPYGQIVELYAARLVKDELAGASTRRRLRFKPSDRLLGFLEAL